MIEQLTEIQAQLSRSLDLEIRLESAGEPLQIDSMTDGERKIFRTLHARERSNDWARGRAALKKVLHSMGCEEDTSVIRWPHPRLSLSHTTSIAVALGTDAATNRGVGVDIEFQRNISARAARFFLTEHERKILGEHPDSATLLRLWTIKEAIFKADPSNQNSVLGHYQVDDLSACEGTAENTRHEKFRYCAVALGNGWLTAACCLESPKDSNVTYH